MAVAKWRRKLAGAGLGLKVVRRMLGRAIHRLVGRWGYDLTNRKVQRFGIDPWLDVERLAATQGPPVRVIFDVGANIGQTSREFMCCFPGATIHAFEPVLSTFEQLIANTSGCSAIHPHNLALSNRVGEAEIFVYPSSLVSSLAADAPFAKHHGIEPKVARCQTNTLDAFCTQNNVQTIDLLKIDTEGFDHIVLAGAAKMLGSGQVRFVTVEFNQITQPLDATGGSLTVLGEALAKHGFRFVASYTDHVDMTGDILVVANALFVRPFGQLGGPS